MANTPSPGFNLSNPKSYIQVPQHRAVITARVGFKGLKFDQALEAPSKASNGLLWMTNMPVFTTHFVNARDAALGERTLYDAIGKPISRRQAQDHWDYLSAGAGDLCSSWLDAKFIEINGEMYVETDHRFEQIKGETHFSGNKRSLRSHKHSGLVSLEFNKDGLATTPSSLDKYTQGENIYAVSPVDGRVAWFGANLGRAVLDCDRGPTFSNSNLGVFACAQKNLIGDLLK